MAKNPVVNSNLRLWAIIISVPILLLIPFIAMQFSSEVVWSLSDFIIAGILLLATGLMFELVLRKFKTTKSRLMLCGIIFLGLVLVWAELAVGVFGTPFAGS